MLDDIKRETGRLTEGKGVCFTFAVEVRLKK
jgi:hypothetical protein